MRNDPTHAFVDYPDVPVANAPSGPLAGLTFAVKDIFDVAGYVTGCGNPERKAESPPATTHAPVVAALLAAGARFVGKTKTAEFAFSLDGRNDHDGTPLNPAAPGRVTGGSSSGSASAVAAGVVDIALGSDTGGSVRAPAAWCGLIGLRTTFGRVDIAGTMPLAPSLDTVGWFARTPEMYARVGAVLLGEDVEGPPLMRMAMIDDAFALLDGEKERAALEPALARVRAALTQDTSVIAAPGGLLQWQTLYRTLQGYEAWKAHGPWLTARKPNLNQAIARRFEVASHVTEAAYREGRSSRLEVMRRVLDLVGKDRVLVLPTTPCIAPRLDDSEAEFERVRTSAIAMLCIAGLASLPQISLPLAKVDGCPLGLSLIGPPGRDRALIDLAARVMAA
ncbi:MAG TPA: amidase [Bauldia sp.]|nr:amidase [Bauldia sp.]